MFCWCFVSFSLFFPPLREHIFPLSSTLICLMSFLKLQEDPFVCRVWVNYARKFAMCAGRAFAGMRSESFFVCCGWRWWERKTRCGFFEIDLEAGGGFFWWSFRLSESESCRVKAADDEDLTSLALRQTIQSRRGRQTLCRSRCWLNQIPREKSSQLLRFPRSSFICILIIFSSPAHRRRRWKKKLPSSNLFFVTFTQFNYRVEFFPPFPFVFLLLLLIFLSGFCWEDDARDEKQEKFNLDSVIRKRSQREVGRRWQTLRTAQKAFYSIQIRRFIAKEKKQQQQRRRGLKFKFTLCFSSPLSCLRE